MSESANCAFHHATPATARCIACRKDVCAICTTTVNSCSFCSGCGVGRVTQKPWLAAVFSLVLPGTGQVYNGQWVKGVAIFLLAALVVPWIWGVVDATNVATEIAAGRRNAATVPTGFMLLGIKILWVPVAIAYSILAAAFIMSIVEQFS